MPHLLIVPLLLSAPLLGPVTRAGIPQDAAAEPKTVLVEKGPFRVLLELDGNFDEPDAAEVMCRPEIYQGSLEVVEAAAPGTVSEGQVLVKFDTEAIDLQIERAALDLEIAKANFERQTQQAQHEQEGNALQRRSLELAHEQAMQTFETFRDVLLPTRLEEAELGMQSSRDRLMDEEAQYEQLLQMYKSDDLVEETEEIVLDRSRRSLEQQRKRLVFTERRNELQTRIDLPRELAGYELALRKATNDWELSKATSELGLAQSKGELRKAELALARQEHDLSRLRDDRIALTVRAPKAGLAVAGQLVRGKWTNLTANLEGPSAGTKLGAGQVLYTIVNPAPTLVRTSVPEASLLEVEVGQSAVAKPTAMPHFRSTGKVIRRAQVSTNGSYDVWLKLENSENALLPGHACHLSLTIHEVRDALTVPQSACRKQGERTLVWVWKDGPVERSVEVGHSSEGRVQILSGLSVGERVLEQAPEKS